MNTKYVRGIAPGTMPADRLAGKPPNEDHGPTKEEGRMRDEITELVDRPAVSDYHEIEFDGRSFTVVVILTLAFLVWSS